MSGQFKLENFRGQCRDVVHYKDMKFGKTLLKTALGSIFALGSADDAQADFIRVKEAGDFMKLQTAVFEYEKDGVRVDLIGAIHIADRRYYEFLNTYFKNYEVLLFEMVGGERLGGGEKAEVEKVEVEEKEADNLEGLRKMYVSMEKALGLVSQGAVVDYQAENFVHADLTMKEFQKLQEERGESLLGFMLQVGMQVENPKEKPNDLRMMKGIFGGRPDLLKLELMQTMASGDIQLDSFKGESVILTDRNAKCMEVLEKQIAQGKEKVGVFYGAAHLADLERRLEKLGFKKSKSKWLTAWSVKKTD